MVKEACASGRVLRSALWLAAIPVVWGLGPGNALGQSSAQAEMGISPDATPQITQIKPAESAPGSEVSVVIDGSNFAPGAYVAFVNPALHAISVNRKSATQIEAKLQIGPEAHPGPVTLYVSNPASAAAQSTFTVSAQPSAPAPAPEVKPADTAPEVTSLGPPRVVRGADQSLKLTGKNFVEGSRVAFSNPGIRVLDTQFGSPTELTVKLRVAPDAATGKSSVFVINPGDLEAEASVEVSDSGSAPAPAPAEPAQPGTTATGETGTAASASYDVYNLGEGINIFQSLNKPKGKLTVAGAKLRYEEGGKDVFSAGAADLKEIEMNVIAGFSTGTFHVILNSGKTYNFAPASLKPADSQTIVDAVRRALH